MSHFQEVTSAKTGDYLPIATAIAFFENEAAEGMFDLKPTGRLWDTAKRLPGIMGFRYAQLQEIEAILVHVEMLASRKTAEHKQHLQATSMRALTDRAMNELVICNDDVFFLRQLENQVSLSRNKFLGLTKGLEFLHFQMNNLVKLREAGIEDATF